MRALVFSIFLLKRIYVEGRKEQLKLAGREVDNEIRHIH